MNSNLFFILVQKVSYLRNHSLTQVKTFYPHTFSSKSFLVLSYVSLFDLFWVHLCEGCKEESNCFLCKYVPGCPNTICSKQLFFPHLIVWLLIKNWVQVCRLDSRLSTLFRWSVCLCLCQGPTVFIIVLKLGSALLFQCCFGYSVFLAFPNGFQHWLVNFCNKETKKEKEKKAAKILLWIPLNL